MNREGKISAIYKEMANKELTFWCQLLIENKWNYITRVIWIKEDWLLECDNWWSYHQEPMTPNETWRMQYKENIWHPIMIWDVMYYIRKKYWNNHSWFHADRDKLIDLRSKEREPIEWQYDECVNFVYSLIPKP